MKKSWQIHAIDKGTNLLKFLSVVALLGFYSVSVPSQAEHLITLIAAFVLGGTELKTKLGL